MSKSKKILLTGLFLNEANKYKIYRTASDQLAEVLRKNKYQVITTSTQPGRLLRLLDTCYTIITKYSQYNIAIVPFFGGFRSLVLEGIICFLLKLLGKKIVLVVHGGSIPKLMQDKPKQYLVVLRMANILVAPSNFLLQALQQHKLEIELIENVLKLNDYQFHLKQNIKPNLFWMRTFEDVYNPLMAVKVFALLLQQYPHSKMVMAGRDAGMLDATKSLAAELKVLDNITFPGYVTIADKNHIANDFDIYICTNNIDNAPVSLIEMMALGVVVVSTNAGGIPYLVTDKYNALIVNIDDEKAMVDAINLLINNPIFANQLIMNGLQSTKPYDEVPVLKKWQNLFARLGYA